MQDRIHRDWNRQPLVHSRHRTNRNFWLGGFFMGLAVGIGIALLLFIFFGEWVYHG